jgi:hypothetical protein
MSFGRPTIENTPAHALLEAYGFGKIEVTRRRLGKRQLLGAGCATDNGLLPQTGRAALSA